MPQLAYTDDQLLKSWRTRNDSEAFNALLQRYTQMVYATCLRILRNPHDAEEVTQDCFVLLAQAPAKVGTYVGPWLHRVATTRSFDRRKVDARRIARQANSTPTGPADQAIPLKDVIEYVDAAIAKLPQDQRDVIIAHFLEGRTQHDIALELGITQQAVFSRVRSGIDGIQKSLRRLGVTASVAAISGALMDVAATALPATLSPALAKLALSGIRNLLPSGAATCAAALTGGLVVKKSILVAVGVTILGAIGYYAISGTSARPDRKAESAIAPKTPVKPTALGDRTPTAPALPLTRAMDPGKTPPPKLRRGEIADAGQFATVSGTVSDVEQNPIAGALVSIVATGIEDHIEAGHGGADVLAQILSDADHIASTTSADNGSYSLEHIRFRGRALVAVQAKGYIVTDSSAGELQIEPSSKFERIDFQLEPGMTMGGVVLAPSGAPLPDASVFCVDSGIAMRTAANGAFSVSVPPGRNFLTFYTTHEVYGPSVFVDLPVREGYDFELRMTSFAAVRGHITLANGNPAAGYTVRIDSRKELDEPIDNEIAAQRAITDEQGAYELTQVSSAFFPVIHVMAANQKPVSPPIDLGALTAGAMRTWDYTVQDGMRVFGQVLTERKRRPLPGVTVVWAIDGSVADETETDDSGHYTLTTLVAPGTHSIAPLATDVPHDAILPEIGVAYGMTISIVPGAEQEVDLTLPDTGSASVVFVDGAGDPVTDGIKVRAHMVNRASASHTSSEIPDADSNGVFSWDGFQPELDCSFDARPRNGSDFIYARTAHFRVTSFSASTPMVVSLHRAGKLSGRLLAADGSVVRQQSFWCNLQLANGETYGPITSRTNWNGQFLLEENTSSSPSAIPATSFQATFNWSDSERKVWTWQSTPLEVAPGETLDVGEIKVEEFDAANDNASDR